MSLTLVTADSVNTSTEFTFTGNLVISGAGSVVVANDTPLYLANGSSVLFTSIANAAINFAEVANAAYTALGVTDGANINAHNISVNGYFMANSTTGTAGQILTSNGANGIYWSDVYGYFGSTGYVGSQGDQGFTGSQGSGGLPGVDGYAGSQGNIGYTGSSGVGYTGSEGSAGYVGSKGAIGLGASSYDFFYSTDVSNSAIANTFLKFSNSDLTYANTLYVSKRAGTTFSYDINTYFYYVSNRVSSIKGDISVYYQDDPSFFTNFNITGSLTDYGDYVSFPINFITGSANNYIANVVTVLAFTVSGDTGYVGSIGPLGYTGSLGSTGYTGSVGAGYAGSKGDAGYTGSQGPAGTFGGAAFEYTYSTNTSHTSTPDGYLNFSNTNLSNANTLYIDYIDLLGSNSYSFLQTIDDSTSAIKGHFSIRDVANTLNYALFAIVGAHTEVTDHFEVPVSYLSGVTSFTNGTNTVITFARTGDIGDTGYTGSQGITGYAGSFGYTGSFGDTGFTGSKGDTGYVGSKGDTGYTGSIGYTGSKGETGFTGSKGDTGYTGSEGYSGSQGNVGYTGSQGDIGNTGYTGSQGSTGFTGSQGSTGFTGSQGIQGDTGYTGSQGDIGTTGFTGSQGVQGTTGFTGYTGSIGNTGYTGSQGDLGYTGSQGNIGYTGSVGYTGSNGYTGSEGTPGTTGYTGSAGFTGSKGDTGNSGFTGSKGDLGYTGSQGPAGEFGGAAFNYLFSTNTTHTSTPNGYLNFNNTSFTSVTNLYIDYIDNLGANSYSFLQTIDDSTSAIKGHFSLRDAANSLNYAMFAITGTHTEDVDHFDVPVSYLSGVTSFTNATNTIITFARTGNVGDTGYTGSIGNTGYTGSKGDLGYTGSAGYTGSVGFTGSQGSQGDIGFTGSVGFTGSIGSVGFTGSVGYTGSKGDLGYTGSTGFVGSQGIVGYTGSYGDLGYTGSIGYTGSSGSANSTITSNSELFTANGTTNTFTLSTSTYSNTTVIVTLNGLLLTPADHYGITGSTLSFTVTPANNDYIEVRQLTGYGLTGYTGSQGPSTMPMNFRTSSYVATANDNGGIISITTGGVTINSGVFSNGQNITIFNNSGSSQTITANGVTMYLAGSATTGNRTLAQRGMCSVFCMDSSTPLFVIAGTGLT